MKIFNVDEWVDKLEGGISGCYMFLVTEEELELLFGEFYKKKGNPK